ncbi:MAG: hypothetical protein PHR15_07370 [Atopobiaceae bacterium]|nr:hypothetical protein [Atopobiaceae bacterium]MCH4180743.1 hypothetical protein [Atopobiaceae bacterium]MCH4215107.1 hypothetical protein [Atopobiaceae bacterium]MCH4277237.1 hypothetical protein [Atopobiaceae bacterium]MCI1226775.1 hypothetical protein [Atopobiaceae bacterium]
MRASLRSLGRVGDVLAQVLLCVLLMIAGFLVVLSATTTVWLLESTDGQLTQNMGIFTVASPSSWLLLLGGIAGLVCVFGLLRLVWCGSSLLDGRAAVAVVLVVALGLQVLWVCLVRTGFCDWGDVWMVSAFAKRAASDGLASLDTGVWRDILHDPRLYFGCYPFQCGLFYYYLWAFQTFGEAWHLVMQLLNIVANEVSALALIGLGRVLVSDVRARRLLLALVALCLPLWWLCAFVYGNAIGMAFGLVFLLMQALALKARGTRRIAWASASVAPLCVCLVFKSTFVLFGIGALICWVVAAVREHGLGAVGGLACSIAVLLVADAVSGLPAAAFTADTGIDTSNGMTTLNHLELGLRDDMHEFTTTYDDGVATVSPGGWSSHANDVWEATGGDADAQDATASECLSDDAARLTSSPSYFAWFFWSKLASLWSEPTYQSLYYSSMCEHPEGGRFNPVDTSAPLGVLCEGSTFVLDGWQLLVYAGALVCLLGMWRGLRSARAVERQEGEPAAGLARDGAGPRAALAALPSEQLLLPSCFFTGFGCYLLWEAKSVYAFPFVLVLLPLAAMGLASVMGRLDGRDRSAGWVSWVRGHLSRRAS